MDIVIAELFEYIYGIDRIVTVCPCKLVTPLSPTIPTIIWGKYDKALRRKLIEGGTKSNVIPDYCKVQVDCRLPFGITQEEVTEILTTKLDGLAIDYSIQRFGFKSVAN